MGSEMCIRDRYWSRASSMGAKLSLFSGLFSLFGLMPVQAFFGVPFDASVIGLLTVLVATLAFGLGSLFFPNPEVP